MGVAHRREQLLALLEEELASVRVEIRNLPTQTAIQAHTYHQRKPKDMKSDAHYELANVTYKPTATQTYYIQADKQHQYREKTADIRTDRITYKQTATQAYTRAYLPSTEDAYRKKQPRNNGTV